MGLDDSTGKTKFVENRGARRNNYVSLFVGIALGILASSLYARLQQQPQQRQEVSSVDKQQQESPRKLGGGASTKNEEIKAVQDQPPASSELEEILRKVAPDKEVLAAVSNKNYLWGEPPMIKTFTDGIKRAEIKNHLILALDDETKQWCDNHGINAYLLKLAVHKAQEGTGENHAVSAMKFGILKPFLDLGWSVLLSDVDIAILQNPFDFLHRDSDVEGMTDGFDEPTAYGSIEGFDDPTMGWARYAQYYKRFNLNSGLFYLRANERTIALMARLDDRLKKTQYWDQTAYNEEIFFLSHGAYKSPQVSVRVMEIDKFMNSKRLFKFIRGLPDDRQPPKPVMIHINYHPDKHERMQAVVKYYVDGDRKPLMDFPGGSEKGSK